MASTTGAAPDDAMTTEGDAGTHPVRRRDFMARQLGIELHPDVLPFSNIPAHLPPFLLRPGRAMTVVG